MAATIDPPIDFKFDPRRHQQLLNSNPRAYADMVGTVSEFGIYLIGENGGILSWNLGASLLTGFEAQDVIGQPFTMLCSCEEDRERQRQLLQFTRQRGHERIEQRRRRKVGDDFFAQGTVDAMRNLEGELTGYVEVFQDITEQRQREDALRWRATRDALTGVFNRGHFADVAAQEIDRARRFHEPLSLLLLDIDYFKKVNDTYGHPAGDQALVALAQCCTGFVRRIDAVGRLGGEEFMILMPRCDKDPAVEIAQRLRYEISQIQVVDNGQTFRYTVSIGVSALRSHTRDFAELLKQADNALYKAKRGGRNCVEAWYE